MSEAAQPVPTTAPAAPPPPPPAAPKAAPLAPVTGVKTKSYATRPNDALRPLTPVVAPVAPAATAAAPTTEGAPAGTTETAPAGETPKTDETLKTDATPNGETPKTDAPVTEEPKAAEEAKEPDGYEVSKRLGRLVRREATLAQERQAFAEEKKQWGNAVARAQDLEKVRQQGAAKKDPFQVLKHFFGVSEKEFVDAVLARQGRSPEQKVQEHTTALEARIADLQKQIDESAAKANEQSTNERAKAYIRDTIGPIVANVERYKHLTAEYGDEAPNEIFKVIAKRHEATGKAPEPQAIADEAEAFLKAKFERQAKALGLSVNPTGPKPQAPKQAEATPPASKQAQPATSRTYTQGRMTTYTKHRQAR